MYEILQYLIMSSQPPIFVNAMDSRYRNDEFPGQITVIRVERWSRGVLRNWNSDIKEDIQTEYSHCDQRVALSRNGNTKADHQGSDDCNTLCVL
jgi:hypothetical protein